MDIHFASSSNNDRAFLPKHAVKMPKRFRQSVAGVGDKLFVINSINK